MNWWLILFITLVFVGSIISFSIGWFAGKKYEKIIKENKDENDNENN